jgi:hypothetical protein
MLIVRDGDDFVAGFEPRGDAERFWTALRARCQPCKLALHPEKTRLIEGGRFAADRRQRRGQGNPATFALLGFTPLCSQTRQGKCTVRRKTIALRRRKQRPEVKAALRRRMPEPIPQQGAWLGRVLRGPYRYYGVPRNSRLLAVFHDGVMRDWGQTLRRRSQRHRITWPRLSALAEQWLAPPQSVHPYPAQR